MAVRQIGNQFAGEVALAFSSLAISILAAAFLYAFLSVLGFSQTSAIAVGFALMVAIQIGAQTHRVPSPSIRRVVYGSACLAPLIVVVILLAYNPWPDQVYLKDYYQIIENFAAAFGRQPVAF